MNQVELEMQLDAHQKARVKLEAVAHRYADLYSFAPVGYLTLESDGTIRELNLAGAKLLGEDGAGRRQAGRLRQPYQTESSTPRPL